MKKLFVGNLPHAVTSEQLQEIFAQFNPTSANVIFDSFTKKSRGFGFVEIEDDQLDPAISALDGQDVEGRTITVSEARPRREGGGGGGERRSFGGGGGGNRSGGGGYRGGGGGNRDGGGFGGGGRGPRPGGGGHRGGGGGGHRGGRGGDDY